MRLRKEMSKGVELFKERLYTIDCDTIYIRERTDDIQGAACDIHKACKGWRVNSRSLKKVYFIDL